ncbi:MAG TPA: TcpE family conjugal transfer membrane protein [Solirubrobacterales bacterium]|nr:TcpE family conjugal transfer membrane protein [Solirubrobacterales bacterium]
MPEPSSRKVVRSYRLVFRRRWRIFRIQNWRIPLPGGLELRLIGYWLATLAATAMLGRLPLAGAPIAAAPPSLRLLVLPIAVAWALSRWEVDGRSPHRALAGLCAWWLRPRVLAAGRRCPPPGSEFAPVDQLALAPDLGASTYPRGALAGPARLLLRYPVRVALEGVQKGAGEAPSERLAAARRWLISPAGGPPLHRGKTLEVPAGRTVVFEPRVHQEAE